MIRFAEGLERGAYLGAEKTAPKRLADAIYLLFIMDCLHRAAIDTGTWSRREFLSLGHCILACCALKDVLQALGRCDAILHRCGLNVTAHRAGKLAHWETIGHPEVVPVTHLWNAHMTVRVGNLLVDPTFGQIQTPWRDVPTYAVFDFQQRSRERFVLAGAGKVHLVASAQWWQNGRTYSSRHFCLPRKVDRATKRWQHRPDAQPARRAAMVARAVQLVKEGFSTSRPSRM